MTYNPNQSMPMMDVLQCLKDEKPDLHKICHVERKWLWFKYGEVNYNKGAERDYLESIGFKWHSYKQRWYHNCGIKCIRSRGRAYVGHGVPVAEANL